MLATITNLPEPVLDLRDLLNTYLEPEKVAIILRAFEVGANAHEGQTRKTGATDAEVRWKQGFSLETLKGHEIRLRFELRDSKLYSFSFQ